MKSLSPALLTLRTATQPNGQFLLQIHFSSEEEVDLWHYVFFKKEISYTEYHQKNKIKRLLSTRIIFRMK